MKSSKNVAGVNKMHWGELPPRETHKQEIITPDIIDNVWRQVLDETSNTDCDYMDYEHDRQPEYIQLPIGNLHVLNTINLQQQIKTMESGVSIKDLTAAENPENSHHFQDSESLAQFMTPQPNLNGTTNSARKISLQPTVAHNILKHAVAVLLAHTGFDNSSDVAIETITDVAKIFLRRITLLLKLASEQKDDEFPDAMERVLVESGVGGVVALHNYYQEFILKYEKNVKIKAEKLLEEQRQMKRKASNIKMELDEISSKFLFEELDAFGSVYQEVPTLQLSDPDAGFPPSLDAGFQMLHSLEQDELNSLEVEEESSHVNNTPAVRHQRMDHIIDKKKK